jgi:hypothetical protein
MSKRDRDAYAWLSSSTTTSMICASICVPTARASACVAGDANAQARFDWPMPGGVAAPADIQGRHPF